MPTIIGYEKGLTIVILRTEDFPDELRSKVKKALLEYLENYKVTLVLAGGDDTGMIYRLFLELSPHFPSVSFSILLSNDKLAYDCDGGRGIGIFSFDPEIAYEDKENAADNRDDHIIRGADVLFCRQWSKYDDINNIRFKSLNPNIHLVVFR